MQALMEPEDNRVEAELCLDALAFVASVVLNMDPQVSSRSQCCDSRRTLVRDR